MQVSNVVELAEIIKKTREERGLSQRQLMKKSNIWNATISRLEAQENMNIQTDTLFALLDALNLKLEIT